MPISQSQHKQLFQWLQSKGVREDCPACGSNDRTSGDVIAPPATPEGGGTVVGGPHFPLVQVLCEHCGFVMHFATPTVGLDRYQELVEEEMNASH